jgi:hypothetical protein
MSFMPTHPDLGHLLGAADHEAGDHIAVAAEILGGRMHHDIGAKLDGRVR